MNISTTRSAIGTSALLFAFAVAAPVFGQSPPNSKPQDKSQDKSQDKAHQDKAHQDKAQQGSNAQGQNGQMEQIGSAYKQLHQVTLSALQEKARGWKDKPAAGGTVPSTDSASSQSMSLRAEELLIATCSGGLLAGAPSSTFGSSFGDARKPNTPPANDNKNDDKNDINGDNNGDNKQGTQPNPNRSSQGAGTAGTDGHSIGMILVHANTLGGATAARQDNAQKGDKGLQEGSGDRDSATRNASSGLSSAPLKAGVYLVKRSGSSIWLNDQQGQTVLRTTLNAKIGMQGGNQGDLGGNQGGSQGGDNSFNSKSAPGQREWDEVFSVIAKEAMSSMGWDKQGSVALLGNK